MDTGAARAVLRERLAKYRQLSYADLLARIDTVEHLDISSGGKCPWQLELQFLWDSEPGGNIRVLGSIDDGGIRAFFPVADAFIKSPSGEFIDE
jgi:hypothetical protein